MPIHTQKSLPFRPMGWLLMLSRHIVLIYDSVVHEIKPLMLALAFNRQAIPV